MKKKIVVVVGDGRVESLFFSKELPEDLEVEVVDFDDTTDSYEDQERKGDYIDHCRDTMTEVVC